MCRVIAALMCLLCFVPPSLARIRGIPYTDRDLAARGARLYGQLLEIARKDRAVSPSGLTRIACRTWAYQSLEKILHGDNVEQLLPPPHAEGWRDLSWLLLQTAQPEAGLGVLKRVRSILEEEEQLLLEIVFKHQLGESVEKPAARLAQLAENPILAERLARRWWTATPPPFRDESVWDQLTPDDKLLAGLFHRLGKILDTMESRRPRPPDTWTLVTPAAAPGQEILLEGAGWTAPAWERATFLQYGKTFPAEAHHIERHHRSRGDTGLQRGSARYGVPEALSQGRAKISVPRAGDFDLTVLSSPAPARIQHVFPKRVLPGGWIRMECVGLQAGRAQSIHVMDKSKSAVVDWPLTAIFSQGGQEWTVDRNVQMWRGWIQDEVVFRAPPALARGSAQVRLKLSGAVSEPYAFDLSDWPDLSNFERENRGAALVFMPGAAQKLMFHHSLDAVAGLVESPSGRSAVWRPATPPAPGQHYAESRWQAPEEWEIGIHDVVWAVREGGLWSIPGLEGETLTVSPFSAAPENLYAYFIQAAPEGSSIHTLGANGYELVPYRRGDILIMGEDIESGETYDISVRFTLGNVYSVRRVSAYDQVLTVGVSPTGPQPEFIDIQRVVGGIPGMPAKLKVEEYGGVMSDLFTAQTEEGKAAVDWLTDVRAKLRAADFREQPPPALLLKTLRIDTFPVSPWGGPWMYIRTPGHPSLTFLAHDRQGNLRAQFYSGGIGAGLVEYDLLTREENLETFAVSSDNLYWTYPWSTNGLGNLVADAVRAAAGAEVGIHNTLGLRGNIPAGPVTAELIEHVLPFDNDLIVLHLKGADFVEMYKEAYADGKFLYVSGMAVEVDSGTRGVTAQIRMGPGKSFSPDAVYRVAMPSYLAEKRAGYPKLARAVKTDDAGLKVRTAVIDHMRKNSPVKADRGVRVAERMF